MKLDKRKENQMGTDFTEEDVTIEPAPGQTWWTRLIGKTHYVMVKEVDPPPV